MTTQSALPTVKITKTMKQKLELYEVQLRKEPSTITHLTSGRTTEVSPSVFALFEIAVKANYIAFMLYWEEQQEPPPCACKNLRVLKHKIGQEYNTIKLICKDCHKVRTRRIRHEDYREGRKTIVLSITGEKRRK